LPVAIVVVALLGLAVASAPRAHALGGPVIVSISPASGPTTGGTAVFITGTGFTGATQVRFGALVAPFSVLNDNQIAASAPTAGASGVVNVSVTGPGGVSPALAGSQFSYTSSAGTGPVIFALSPSSGPVGGGTSVVISGTGLMGTSAVTFGVTPAAFFVTNDSQITAIAPASLLSGIVGVTVMTPLGASAPYPYTYGFGPAVLAVTSVTPPAGPLGGGTTVTITGSGFLSATQVAFGSNGSIFYILSDSQITAMTPAAQTPGTVDVIVTTPGGSTLPGTGARFTYLGANPSAGPSVASLVPSSGPTSGGTSVTITGSGFTGATGVTFGGAAATFTMSSDSQIVAVAPAHAAGTVDVIVTTTPRGPSAPSVVARFTYSAPAQNICPALPLWVDDLAYGSPGGGFYYDPISGQVWTPARGWHLFSPQPPRPNPQPLWVDAPTYGSPGGGFYYDPISGRVWTPDRGWHAYGPQGCVTR
jgi:hypothetical protein